MNLTNTLKDRVEIRLRVATLTASGETVTWIPVTTAYARKIPLKVEARAVYQQLNSTVTDKFVFRKGAVSLSIGKNRLLHGGKTYELVDPPQNIADSIIVVVKEV